MPLAVPLVALTAHPVHCSYSMVACAHGTDQVSGTTPQRQLRLNAPQAGAAPCKTRLIRLVRVCDAAWAFPLQPAVAPHTSNNAKFLTRSTVPSTRANPMSSKSPCTHAMPLAEARAAISCGTGRTQGDTKSRAGARSGPKTVLLNIHVHGHWLKIAFGPDLTSVKVCELVLCDVAAGAEPRCQGTSSQPHAMSTADARRRPARHTPRIHRRRLSTQRGRTQIWSDVLKVAFPVFHAYSVGLPYGRCD